MINFPFGTNGKLIILDVPILKHVAVGSSIIWENKTLIHANLEE